MSPGLDHLCAEYLAYYHQERPHHGTDNELLTGKKVPKPSAHQGADVITLAGVRCQQRLGGLLKHYSRKAA